MVDLNADSEESSENGIVVVQGTSGMVMCEVRDDGTNRWILSSALHCMKSTALFTPRREL